MLNDFRPNQKGNESFFEFYSFIEYLKKLDK